MITQELWIPMKLPGLNEIIDYARKRRGRSNLYSLNKKIIEKQIALMVRLANIKPMTSCFCVFNWFEPNGRRDIDNVAVGRKFILDALVTANILKDDSRRYVKGFEDYFPLEKGKVGVLVEMRGR